MRSETTMVAKQCRLREWAAQIRDCQSRPAGMSVVEWCACHDITKANYYYRLRRVREACLETIREEMPARQMVPVQSELLQHQEQKSTVRTGYFHKRILHPCNGIHVHASSGIGA